MKTKINNIVQKVKQYIKTKNNWGIISLGLIVIIFLLVTVIYLNGTNNVSSIEQNTIKEQSKKIVNYIDDIIELDSKDIDKYIILALDYSSNTDNKKELTVDEIYNFLADNFTLKTSTDEIRNQGISPLMLGRNIIYNAENDSYQMVDIKTDTNKIATTSINYYKLTKINKKNKKKYVITYTKYTIDDPYKILNYYISQNNNVAESEIVDITVIRNYLLGGSTLADLKNSLNDNDLEKFATKGKKVKITYIVKNGKLYIDNIK